MIAFLSYSRADRGTVAHFDAELQRAGIDGWRDVEGIRGGEQWRTEIVEAIQHADAFVLFVSPAAMRSDNVRRELTVAEEDHKPIVPVLIEPSQVPEYFRYSLAGLEYIDVPALGSDEAFSRLHAALVALDGSHRPVTDVPAPPTPTSPTRRRVSANVFSAFDPDWRRDDPCGRGCRSRCAERERRSTRMLLSRATAPLALVALGLAALT